MGPVSCTSRVSAKGRQHDFECLVTEDKLQDTLLDLRAAPFEKRDHLMVGNYESTPILSDNIIAGKDQVIERRNAEDEAQRRIVGFSEISVSHDVCGDEDFNANRSQYSDQREKSVTTVGELQQGDTISSTYSDSERFGKKHDQCSKIAASATIEYLIGYKTSAEFINKEIMCCSVVQTQLSVSPVLNIPCVSDRTADGCQISRLVPASTDPQAKNPKAIDLCKKLKAEYQLESVDQSVSIPTVQRLLFRSVYVDFLRGFEKPINLHTSEKIQVALNIEKTRSVSMMYFQNDSASYASDRVRYLPYADVKRKFQQVQFIRNTEQIKQRNERELEDYKMREAFNRFKSYNCELWLGRRPMELARLLCNQGLFLSHLDEQVAAFGAFYKILKVRCTFCKRTLDARWCTTGRGLLGSSSSAAYRNNAYIEALQTCYEVANSVRNDHCKFSPTCPIVLDLNADNVPFTSEQDQEIEDLIKNDPYFLGAEHDLLQNQSQEDCRSQRSRRRKKSAKRNDLDTERIQMKDLQELEITLSESQLSEEDSKFLSSPDQFSNVGQEALIQPNDIFMFNSWLEYDRHVTPIFNPTFEDEKMFGGATETEFSDWKASDYKIASTVSKTYASASKDSDDSGNSELSCTTSSSASMPNSTPSIMSSNSVDSIERNYCTLAMFSNAQMSEPLFPMFCDIDMRLRTFSSTGVDDLEEMLKFDCLEAPAPTKTDLMKKFQCNPEDEKAMIWLNEYCRFKQKQLNFNKCIIGKFWKETWAENDPKQPLSKRIADAGFFYSGFSDICVCFSCGLALQTWSIDAVPFIEHVRHSFNCRYLVASRGKQFVFDTKQLYPSCNAQTKYSPLFEELLKDNGRLQNFKSSVSTLDSGYRTMSKPTREKFYSELLHYLGPKEYRIEDRDIRARLEMRSIHSLAVNAPTEIIAFVIGRRLRETGTDFPGMTELLQATWDVQSRTRTLGMKDVTEFSRYFNEALQYYKKFSAGQSMDAHEQVVTAPSFESRTNGNAVSHSNLAARHGFLYAALSVEKNSDSVNSSAAYASPTPELLAKAKELKLCRLCVLRPAEIVLMPCSELAVCLLCFRVKNVDRCPNCGLQVREGVKIYV